MMLCFLAWWLPPVVHNRSNRWYQPSLLASLCRQSSNHGRQRGWQGEAPEGAKEGPQGVRRGRRCFFGQKEGGGEGAEGPQGEGQNWLRRRRRTQKVGKEVRRPSSSSSSRSSSRIAGRAACSSASFRQLRRRHTSSSSSPA